MHFSFDVSVLPLLNNVNLDGDEKSISAKNLFLTKHI